MKQAKILIVEDTDAVREVLTRQCEALGCAVTALVSGGDVKKALSDSHFDLVMTDWQLPDCSGIDIARFAQARKCPVVLLTGHNEAGKRPDIKEVGFAAILEKPLTLEQLQNILFRFRLIKTDILPSFLDTPVSDDSILDVTSLREQMGELDESALMMLSRFPPMMRGLVDNLNMAFDAGDMVRVAEIAHSLKGAARSAGATRLAERCDHIQSLAQTGCAIDDLIPLLRDDFQKTETALMTLCAQ